MIYQPHMLPKLRSDQIMAAAAGSPCTLRIASFLPGLQCAGRETTVACHLPIGWGKGVSTKVTDMATAFGCRVCHDILDGRNIKAREYLMENHAAVLMQRYLSALTETHALLIAEGIIVVPDAKMT